MSRIGKKPIKLPDGVEVIINRLDVFVKGPKGSLSLTMHPLAKAAVKEIDGAKNIVVSMQKEEDSRQGALWGLTARLIANMVKGVTVGYEKKLEINGVGFKAAVVGDKVKLEVGFSHSVEYILPPGISAAVEKNVITISGIAKQSVGEAAAQIRKIKVPEPYKGKGIKYIDEVVRRKAGKAAKAAA